MGDVAGSKSKPLYLNDMFRQTLLEGGAEAVLEDTKLRFQ